MTDDELKKLVASLAVSQKETDTQIKELSVSQKETDTQIKEMAKDLSVSQKKMAKDLSVSQKKMAKDLSVSQKETDKQIKELGKQIGGLGNRIGSYTEGLALPSMQRLLQDKFKMEIISPSVRAKKDGQEMEIDVLAYANSTTNEVYVVEVKTHLKEEAITQLQKIIKNFRTFFPEHKDKKLFGIMTAVDMSEYLKEKLLSLGFYVAKIKEDVFSLDTPPNFIAKSY